MVFNSTWQQFSSDLLAPAWWVGPGHDDDDYDDGDEDGNGFGGYDNDDDKDQDVGFDEDDDYDANQDGVDGLQQLHQPLPHHLPLLAPSHQVLPGCFQSHHLDEEH